MSERLHAASVLARRRLYEALTSPAYYVAVTLGLVLAGLAVSGFVQAVDSSGLAFDLHPVYDLVGRSLEGAFGWTLVERLFAEGPYLFALHVAFLPLLLYLAVSSVFRLGLERRIGVLQLLACGPADGTAALLAALIADMLLTALYLLVLFAFSAITAALFNLLLGPAFYSALFVLLFTSGAVYAYGVLAASMTDNSASAVGAFAGLMLFFAAVLMGSFTIVSDYVLNLSTVFAWIIRWVSPLHYWVSAMGAAETHGWLGYAASLLVLSLLAAAVVTGSHFILRARGVRS